MDGVRGERNPAWSMTIRPRTERDVRSGSMQVRLYQLDRGSHQRASPPPVVTGDVRGERTSANECRGSVTVQTQRSEVVFTFTWRQHESSFDARVIEVSMVAEPPGFMFGFSTTFSWAKLRANAEREREIGRGPFSVGALHPSFGANGEIFIRTHHRFRSLRRSRRADEALEFERTAETPHGSPWKLAR